MNNSNNHLQDIVKNINAESSKVRCLIRSYSQVDTTSLLDMLSLSSSTYRIIEYTYNNFPTNPYEPFVNWIDEEIKNNSLEPNIILEELNTPEILKPVFNNYFTEGCAMHEENLWECVDYEKETIINILIGMLEYFSKLSPVIFVLKNIQLAPVSVLRLLNDIIRSDDILNISIIANYYAAAEILNYKITFWEALIRTAQINGKLIDFESTSEICVLEINSYLLTSDSLDDLFNIINNNLEFRELEDAQYMIDEILIHINNIDIDSNKAFELYELCAYNYTLLRNHNEVLRVCDKLIDNCNSDYSDYKMFTYHYYLGRARLILGQNNDAKLSAEKALEYAQSEENDYHLMLANILLTMIKYHNCLHDSSVKRITDENLIQLMMKYKFYNHIAILLCIWSDNNINDYSSPDLIEHNCTNYMRAINILTEHNNPRMLCSVYRFFIVRTSNCNYYVANKYFYKKYISVLTKGSLEEIYATMGMGYINTINEHYNEAIENYECALRSCMNICDIIHIAEALYNLSNNSFLSRDYIYAINYASLCLWITDTMNYSGLFVTSLIRLHAIKAISHYRDDNYLLCNAEYLIIKRIVTNSENIVSIDNDDLFFYNYINALMLYHEEEYNMSLELIIRSESYLKVSSVLMKTQYITFSIDKINILEKLGREDERRNVVAQVSEYCQHNNLQEKYLEFISLLEDNKSYELHSFPINSSLSESIVDLVINHYNSLQLKKQLKERDFVAKWLSLITSYIKKEISIEDLFTEYLYNCCMKELILLVYTDGQVLQFTSHSSPLLPTKSASEIFSIYERYRYGFVTDYLSPNYNEFRELFSLCNLENVSSAVGLSCTEGNTSFILLSYKYSVEQNVSLTADTMHLDYTDLKMYVSLFQQLIRLLIQY